MSALASRVSATTPPHEIPYWLRVSEVAVWLGLSESAVREAIQRGDIPAHRVGKSGSILRILRDDILRLIEQ